MHIDTIHFGELTPEQFLAEYWQKKPLLIRQAFPHFQSPITPDELAGLACEPNAEVRLILEKGGKKPWEVRYGALKEKDFAKLPKTHWTFLVQEVNKHIPEIEDILDRFNFVPAWRVDDLMISYAVPYGSVGPHLDSYDVFLLQAHGQRRWEISHDNGELIPNLDLKILKEFIPEQSWVLDVGDMLYLPPNIAHNGVALTECMTFSIGFLAPTHTDIVSSFVHDMSADWDENLRYSDPDLKLQNEVGEITTNALQKIQTIIRSLPVDESAINQWFGKFITENRTGVGCDVPDPLYSIEEWLAEFEAQGILRRTAKMAFIREEQHITLFAEGHAFPVPSHLAFAASLLTRAREFQYEELVQYLESDLLELLVDFTNRGYFYFYEP